MNYMSFAVLDVQDLNIWVVNNLRLFFFFFFETVSLCIPGWPGPGDIDQAGLKLPPEC